MAELVLVTEGEFRKAEAAFRAADGLQIEPAPVAEEPLAAAVRAGESRAVIVGVERYAGPLYEALAASGRNRGGAILARFGVGHDGIDKPLARRHGIVVTNTPGMLDLSVAEHAIWLMGSLARHISGLEAKFRGGQFASCVGSELHGKSLGIIGFGSIGRHVAAMAHFGLGMTVLAAARRSPEEVERDERRSLDEILAAHGTSLYTNQMSVVFRQADIVSLHLPSIPETRHAIDAARLTEMKPEALLINSARGAILDENALYDALAARRIAGAALDVFETEPYEPPSPDKDLRTLENIVLTPHIGSNTREANDRMARACLDNLAKFFAGRMDELTRVD